MVYRTASMYVQSAAAGNMTKKMMSQEEALIIFGKWLKESRLSDDTHERVSEWMDELGRKMPAEVSMPLLKDWFRAMGYDPKYDFSEHAIGRLERGRRYPPSPYALKVLQQSGILKVYRGTKKGNPEFTSASLQEVLDVATGDLDPNTGKCPCED